MKLPEVLDGLEAGMPAAANWRVVVLTHRDPKVPTEMVEFPIREISVDHPDEEINLITDEDAVRSLPNASGLTVEQLLTALRSLPERCAGYSVYSGSAWVGVDSKHELRYDCPLVGMARNPNAEVYGFLQWPAEQWEPTA